METWVALNGELTPGEEARVSVFDRGFLFGDSVYEVLWAEDGRLVFWPEHRDRLLRSAELVHLPLEVDTAQLRAETEAVAMKLGGRVYLRVVVTRGEGGLRLDPTDAGHATRVVIGRPLVPDPAVARGYVLHTTTVPDAGLSPQAKSTFKLPVVLAVREARAQGADEVLRVTAGGEVLEGGTSTFFLVKDGALRTPPIESGILEGITRRKVLEAAAEEGLEAQETRVTLDDVRACDEAFITSSTRGVVPARRIDAQALPNPGPVTARVQAAYEALVARALTG